MATGTVHYTIRPTSESSVGVEVFKTGLMKGRKHVLFFEHYRGELHYGDEIPEENSRVELVVEAESAVCRDQWLNPQRQASVLACAKNDILATERHAQITFSAERFRRKGSNRFEVEGPLTIRSISKPLVAEVAILKVGDRLEVDGRARLKLSDYEVEPPRALWGLAGTKNEIGLRFLLFPQRTGARQNKGAPVLSMQR